MFAMFVVSTAFVLLLFPLPAFEKLLLLLLLLVVVVVLLAVCLFSVSWRLVCLVVCQRCLPLVFGC